MSAEPKLQSPIETLIEALRVAGSTGCDLSPGDPLCLAAAQVIEQQRDALKVAYQAVLEVAHAQDVGANWWTHGENAMYQHIRMHVLRALNAIRTTGEY